jgi:hypothetical protein
MTRAHHVTHSYTAARIENIRKLVGALMVGQLLRDEIGDLLGVSPSCVRKYLADLCQVIEPVREGGAQVCRLKIDAAAAQAYLAALGAQQHARSAPKAHPSLLELAQRDPGRHIHIMRDDEEYKPRMFRALPQHEPMMAHFYGMACAEVRA